MTQRDFKENPGASPTKSSRSRPSRLYKNSESTKLRLILAAEELVGKCGIGGLSAREIAKKTNLRNNASVQYHFGTLDELLKSVMKFRMRQLDLLRDDIISSTSIDLNECNLYTIFKYYALTNLTLARQGGNGATYAAFMCEYLPYNHPLSKDILFKDPPHTEYPALNRLVEQILARISHLPLELAQRRLTNATLLFFHVLRSMAVEDFQDHRMLETSRITSDTLPMHWGSHRPAPSA
mgnify:CR=1 FL=1